MSEKHEATCPLVAVHKRLDDLHHQWHIAEQAYFEPDEFRMAIQTAIQTSRTVSFILQNHKRLIPDFDKWYGAWQDRFRDQPLMRWMVDARNKIEKQGDLEAHSFVRADVVASYYDDEGPSIEVKAELWDAPIRLLKRIPDTGAGAHIKKDGVLRIQRRWIENTLPDHELLDAVAHAYGQLSLLLADAHVQMGLKPPQTLDENTGQPYDSEAMQGRMPCMIGHSDLRTLDIWIATGAVMELTVSSATYDEEAAVKAAERYGLAPEKTFAGPNDPSGHLRSLFATAQKMFLADGHHISMLFLMKEGKTIDMMAFAPEEHGEKYLIMRKVAQQAQRKGADAVVLLGEVWMSQFDKSAPYRRPADAPDREEGLRGVMVPKNGEPLQLTSRIRRTEKTLELDQPIEQIGGAHYMFIPFYHAWGKPVPEEWKKMEEKMENDSAEAKPSDQT